MFCDLVGSTQLSTLFDPEDLHKVLGRYQAEITPIVERCGGYVARFIGDGLLAYFGWPRASDADAERAVHAALAVLDAVGRVDAAGQELRVRIGIATGLVVVGDVIGSGLAQEHAAVGEAPNLAARLQAVAEPNSIVISDATRIQIGDLFFLTDLGALDLKGFPHPVRAWRVAGEGDVRNRFDALRTTKNALIGRDEEIAELLRRWDEAKRGEGRMVLVSGEPGIGKSRLIKALQEHMVVEDHTRLAYFCAPHQQDSALRPIIGQLQHAAGFGHNDSSDEKGSKLRALLASYDAEPEDITLLEDLLSLRVDQTLHGNFSPQRRKEKTFGALARCVEQLSRRQPVLMVFEDAHWSDPTTLELLEFSSERFRKLPVLLIVTFRPELQSRWIGRPGVSLIALSRLDGDQSAVLIAQVVGRNLLPAVLVESIVAKADGVPLFIEELTKAVIENSGPGDHRPGRAIAAFNVPVTLQASLMARLDRLPGAKEVAQIASVIGREFSYELLRAVAAKKETALRTALDRLVASELMFCRGLPPQANYVFKHALVCDAAYGMVLRRRRQELHGAVARALEEGFTEIVETHPEVLAHHHREAGQASKAISYLYTGAERALQRSASTEATTQLSDALELLLMLPEDDDRRRQELKLQVALARALIATRGYQAPETQQAYRRARALCDQLNDRVWLPLVILGHWITAWSAADYAAALKQAQEMSLWGEREDDRAGKAVGHLITGVTLVLTGALREAQRHLEQGLAIDQFVLPGRPPLLSSDADGRFGSLMCLHNCLLLLGWPAKARAAAERAFAQMPTQLYSLALAHTLRCRMHVLERDAEKSANAASTLFKLAEDHGYPLFVGSSSAYWGWALAQTGSPDKGIELCRKGIAQLRAIGTICYLPHYLMLLAECHEKSADAEGGLRVIDDAFQAIELTGERLWEPELHRTRGQLMLLAGAAPTVAENCFRQALTAARNQDARLFELRTATKLASLLAQCGRRSEAINILLPIHGWFAEGFDNADIKEAKALLDHLQ